MAKIEELFQAIIQGDQSQVAQLVQAQLDQQADMKAVLMDSMVPAMREIGERFSRNEVYVPEMLIAARAMQAGLNLIEPVLAATGHASPAKVCIGTVKGDLHDIGKNLVAMMVKGAGFEVVDLGVDCGFDKFKAAIEGGAQIIMLSALLTTTMAAMKSLVEDLKPLGVRVIVGGAPVTQEYADQIGADGYAQDANMAVKTLEQVLAA